MREPTRDHPPGRSDRADGARFEPLDETECWSLLAGSTVGRVAVVIDGATEIFPVNFVVDRPDDQPPGIVFRTAPGTKLAGLGQNPRVSFEVDDLDVTGHGGWTVVVKGRARQVRELADATERDRIEHAPVDNWDATPKPHWIRIEPSEVTGRQVTARLTASPGDLPTLAEWSERNVWVPPEHTGARP
jgi:nitroimidazol reductase NimA-like FMN-containing flavoprotein (pyridoxamine 5'-phosphate oxidase superfamily)